MFRGFFVTLGQQSLPISQICVYMHTQLLTKRKPKRYVRIPRGTRCRFLDAIWRSDPPAPAGMPLPTDEAGQRYRRLPPLARRDITGTRDRGR